MLSPSKVVKTSVSARSVPEPVLRQVALPAARLATGLDGGRGVPGRERLRARGARLELALTLLVDVPARLPGGLDVVEHLDELVLREPQRVGARQARQQLALVGEVVEHHDLVLAARRGELPAGLAVAHGDGLGQRRGAHRAARDADAAADERAEHGEEAAVLALDRARVRAVLGDGAVAVEQVLARHAHAAERQPAVVDAVEPLLVPVVGDLDAREHRAVVVAQRDEDRVHAVPFGRVGRRRRVELHEHRRHPPVAGGVADVVLARRLGRGVDDELAGVRRRRSPSCAPTGRPSRGRSRSSRSSPGARGP